MRQCAALPCTAVALASRQGPRDRGQMGGMMTKTVALLCLAAAAVAPATAVRAQTAPAAPVAPVVWTPFTPPGGEFTASFPAVPKRSDTALTQGPGSPGNVVMFTSASPEGIFLAGWADYAPGFKFDPQAELAANRDNFVKGVQGKLLATRAIRRGGATGMEFDVEEPGAWMGRARVYIIGGKPWQLIAINRGARLDAAQAARFFDSFKLGRSGERRRY